MSICRTSSNGGDCDIYIFDSGSYWNIVIAHSRLGEKINNDDTSLFNYPKYPIGGKYDGCMYQFEYLENLYEFLKELRQEGYRFPDWVFDDINSIIKESKIN